MPKYTAQYKKKQIAIHRAAKKNKKLKLVIPLKDLSPWGCPNCGNHLRINLIRRRYDMFDCRVCETTFFKDDAKDNY